VAVRCLQEPGRLGAPVLDAALRPSSIRLGVDQCGLLAGAGRAKLVSGQEGVPRQTQRLASGGLVRRCGVARFAAGGLFRNLARQDRRSQYFSSTPARP